MKPDGRTPVEVKTVNVRPIRPGGRIEVSKEDSGAAVAVAASKSIRLDGEQVFIARATDVLRMNDAERSDGRRFTRASPKLYPHQWSWDSAFIAMGWAQVDPVRAVEELSTLFSAQWDNGKVPHIVFNPSVPQGQYFPDAERWDSQASSPHAPQAGIQTSGIIQPPVHAIAVARVLAAAAKASRAVQTEVEEAIRELYPKLLAWHRYLLSERDPEKSGLVTIVHPWESGHDNSPRWDGPLKAVTPDLNALPPYERADLKHVADPSERPSQEDYDRYLWLLELYKRVGYDDGQVYRAKIHNRKPYPFLVKDVLLSAILVRANEALLDTANRVGAGKTDGKRIRGWIERGQKGLSKRWNAKLSAALDFDLRARKSIHVRTLANFAPLIAGGLSKAKQQAQCRLYGSKFFTQHPKLARPLPPSTSPGEKTFHPMKYWRGPSWPVMNWLMWWGLSQSGETGLARELKDAALAQLRDKGFHEYFNVFTDEAIGSPDQSWTAAVALDWEKSQG